MKKTAKILIYLLTLALTAVFLGPAVSVRALSDPQVTANHAVLAELESGQILYAKDAYSRAYPASTTKIMTALVALDACQEGRAALSNNVVVADDIYFDITPDGSTQKIQPQEEMTLENLLYCMLLASANESCNAVAEYISGSVASFVNEMNAMASELGCTGTHFANTHGMPNENHYTTANDLMLIMRKAMSIPAFQQIISTDEYTVPATNLSEARNLKNTNNLIRKNSPYYYEYAKGGKTGYTNAAGYCLASAAQQGDLSLVAIVLGTDSVQAADGTTQTMSFVDSRTLYQWGFSNFSYRTIISTLDLVKEIPVELGNGAGSVILRPEKNIVGLLANDVDLTRVEMVVKIYSEETGEPLIAPIAGGEALGEAEVRLDGKSYGTISLVANSGVELDKTKFIASEVGKTLSNRYVRLGIFGVLFLFLLYISFIILYNVNRRRRRQEENALARKRVEEIRRGESLSTGMSFEEIEARYAKSSGEQSIRRR